MYKRVQPNSFFKVCASICSLEKLLKAIWFLQNKYYTNWYITIFWFWKYFLGRILYLIFQLSKLTFQISISYSMKLLRLTQLWKLCSVFSSPCKRENRINPAMSTGGGDRPGREEGESCLTLPSAETLSGLGAFWWQFSLINVLVFSPIE